MKVWCFSLRSTNSTLSRGWNHANFLPQYSLETTNLECKRQTVTLNESQYDSCFGFDPWGGYVTGAITRTSIVGGDSISGSLCTIGLPFATSVKIWLIVSSVRVDVTCSLRTARMAVDARRRRFPI